MSAERFCYALDQATGKRCVLDEGHRGLHSDDPRCDEAAHMWSAPHDPLATSADLTLEELMAELNDHASFAADEGFNLYAALLWKHLEHVRELRGVFDRRRAPHRPR